MAIIAFPHAAFTSSGCAISQALAAASSKGVISFAVPPARMRSLVCLQPLASWQHARNSACASLPQPPCAAEPILPQAGMPRLTTASASHQDGGRCMWTLSIEFAAKGASFRPRILGPSCNRLGDTPGESNRPHQLIQEAQVPARFGKTSTQLMGHD